jgi:hypothetical protein
MLEKHTMNHKMMSGTGCLLLLAAALVPKALGHDDNQSRPNDVDGGVTGQFYGPAGYYVSLDPGLYDPTSGDPVSLDCFVAQGRMNCDREVSGDGSSGLMIGDETRVDGTQHGSNTMQDGTFDDGGFGGACHTSSADYAFQGYNSPGCVDDGARASNFDVGVGIASPWVGAACDWKTESGATPCDPLPNTGGTTRCTSSTCISPCTFSCGSDGIMDGINFGFGHYRVAYPYTSATGSANSFTGDGLGCLSSEATMAAFVFNGVTVTQVGTSVTPTVNSAIQGEIWQVA